MVVETVVVKAEAMVVMMVAKILLAAVYPCRYSHTRNTQPHPYPYPYPHSLFRPRRCCEELWEELTDREAEIQAR